MQRIGSICINDFKHLPGDLRIKLRPHIGFNFRSDLILRHKAAVAAVGGHGVVAVRDGDDTGKQRYFLAAFSVRISLSVITFVVPPGTDRQIGTAVYFFKNIIAGDRMLLYQIILILCELIGLLIIASGTPIFPTSCRSP